VLRLEMRSICSMGLVLMLAACASSPKPVPEPALRLQALEVEKQGAHHYAQGDYAGAIRRFAQAQRLQQSLDDVNAAARNRLHQAQAELARDQAALALSHAREVEPVLNDAEADARTLRVTALLLQGQAYLALQQAELAQATLAQLNPLCVAGCADLGRLRLLQAYTALAQGQPDQALSHVQAALPLLRAQQEWNEVGNAWRLSGRASLSRGDTVTALTSTQAALDMDRQLALPEKIARDWLLMGDIYRRAQGTPATQASSAYQRALAVAQAAGLAEIVKLASVALKESVQ
jgi:tetratricopeptide (TPR) repeat protein